MKISTLFIDRPIFAGVLSALIVLAGVCAMFQLPVMEYPDMVPPSVVVRAQLPGANPQLVAETVAAPIEEQLNGTEGMLYMSSQATTDGLMTLTATFKLGTAPDLAQQLVQNRVARALPHMPPDTQRIGITVDKNNSNFMMAVHIVSPHGRYDTQYLRNYAVLNVKNRLARIDGVGDVRMLGGGDYAMRIWLDPAKVAAHGLAASDVVDAIRKQNVDVAAGVIGAAPSAGSEFQFAVHARGRLQTPEEFGAVVVRTSANGAVTRLADVARVELGANDYALRSQVDNRQASTLALFQASGSNALDVAQQIYRTMDELKRQMPEDVDYLIVYDTTKFVRSSIHAVVWTLLEAVLLVVVVVVLFLQSWRASIIPLLSMPVSVIGTFAVMYLLDFSINTLSLFGLVLAIGIVVDDAIVVVENVERYLAAGLNARAAACRAMQEVSWPVLAISAGLIAVFVPLAFASGLTGRFYQQFALTVAISTAFSALNSLTLAPALASLLLKPNGTPPDRFQRLLNRVCGPLFGRFNRVLATGTEWQSHKVRRALSRKTAMLAMYGVLVAASFALLETVPRGFVPTQDKQYLIAFANLPAAASLDRSDKVIERMTTIARRDPDVESAIGFPGLSVNGFTNSSNAGIVFVILKPFGERTAATQSSDAVAQRLNQEYGVIEEAVTAVFPPPPVTGVGTIGGFRLQLEDQGVLGNAALDKALRAFLDKARKSPELANVFSSFQIDVPQLEIKVDRTKIQQLALSPADVFGTLQIYLGSLYVNDFNAFGRTYQVRVQADAPFRGHPEDILKLKARNRNGEMIPLSAVLSVSKGQGPERAMRYNGFGSADISGSAAPGYSSRQAQEAIERIASATLPPGITYEWTDLTYQENLAHRSAALIVPVSMLLVFLLLAALYESLSLPLAVLLIVPVAWLSALLGIWATGGENDVFAQIGMLVLVGLACKNAILIVEFAQDLERQGHSASAAAIEATRLRLRPILMTSIAFIAGVIPLIFAHGAAAEMRHALGVAVFFGMLGVTLFGLLLTPVFYVAIRTVVRSPVRPATFAVEATK
jgi:multidrug efflux pump